MNTIAVFRPELTWGTSILEDSMVMAARLDSMTWTLCTGFQYKQTVWVNISLTEDSLQEYAVLRIIDHLADASTMVEQVESITVSWCNMKRLQELIEHYAAVGSIEAFGKPFAVNLEYEHHLCELCA